MKSWREQAVEAGASITVEAMCVTVYHPASMMMVREVVSMGGLGETVEACCKELVKNIESRPPAQHATGCSPTSTTRGGPQS
jgi:hypothetical protein